MSDYIVKFRKGDKVLGKKGFSELRGKDGAELHILTNSSGRNLYKEYNWIVRREHASGFREYDNNGLIDSYNGIDVGDLAFALYTEKLVDRLKRGKD